MNQSRYSSASARETAGISLYRPTWAEIDHRAFSGNIKRIAGRLRPRTKILAVVKANAYGHGALALSRLAVKAGAAMLGVSSLEEGIHLRDNGVKAPILILGSLYPFENLAVAADYALIPTVSSLKGLNELGRLALRRGKVLPFHLKVDTGMGRVGVTPLTAQTVLDRIASRKEIALKGLYMHFAAADSDPAFSREQMKRFTPVVEHARRLGLRFDAHAANSAALLKFPEYQLDMVRPGICLYGLLPFDGADRILPLRPVMSLKSRIVFLKRVPKGCCISYGRTFTTKRSSLIATLPIGYADGFSRFLSNRGEVLVGGVRCPIVGRVTMDMIMADVTRVPSAPIGAEVVIIGAQGHDRIRMEELASQSGTISYEVACAVSSRVPRVPR